MEEDKGDVALLRRLDKPDVAERVQCWRQQAGSHIDQGDGSISRIDGVEDRSLYSHGEYWHCAPALAPLITILGRGAGTGAAESADRGERTGATTLSLQQCWRI